MGPGERSLPLAVRWYFRAPGDLWLALTVAVRDDGLLTQHEWFSRFPTQDDEGKEGNLEKEKEVPELLQSEGSCSLRFVSGPSQRLPSLPEAGPEPSLPPSACRWNTAAQSQCTAAQSQCSAPPHACLSSWCNEGFPSAVR